MISVPETKKTPSLDDVWEKNCHHHIRLKKLEDKITEHDTEIQKNTLERDYLKKDIQELKSIFREAGHKLAGIERRFIEEDGAAKFKNKLGRIADNLLRVFGLMISIGLVDFIMHKLGWK